MNEMHFAYRIRQYLNSGLHDLRPGTIKRLATAREHALARQKIVVHESVLAAAGSFIQHRFDNLHLKQVFTALVILVGVALFTLWHADQSITELEAVDTALLADDLPIGAFTDKGFDTWVKSASPQ